MTPAVQASTELTAMRGSGFTPTARQRELLRYIAGYMDAHGNAPSYEEMAAATGTCKSSIYRLVIGLQERNMINRRPLGARTITLVAPVSIPRAPDGAPLYFVPPPRIKPESRAA